MSVVGRAISSSGGFVGPREAEMWGAQGGSAGGGTL